MLVSFSFGPGTELGLDWTGLCVTGLSGPEYRRTKQQEEEEKEWREREKKAEELH